MKTLVEIQDAISRGMSSFEQENMGHGPRDVRSHLLGDFLIVRLQGVLTASEQHMVKKLQAHKGRELLKQVRKQLMEAGRPIMEAMIQEITGVKVLSLHHDVSTVTGEEIVIFTLVSRPHFLEVKRPGTR